MKGAFRLFMAKAKKNALAVLGAFVLLMVFLVTWSARQTLFESPFVLEEVLLCEELNEAREPVHPGTLFAYGTRQVCLWFRYGAARGGDNLKVKWYYQNRLIHVESMQLFVPKGIKAFYLIKEDGSPLPKGLYKVTIELNGRLRSRLEFRIASKTL